MSDIKLFNDNCMKILPTLPDGSITMTLTDIPYDEVNRKSGGLRNLDKSHADIITFPLDEFIDEIVRVTSGSIYIFCGSVQVSHIRNRLIEHNMSVRHCIWEKTNPSPMNGQHIWLSSIEIVCSVKNQELHLMSIVSQQYGDTLLNIIKTIQHQNQLS